MEENTKENKLFSVKGWIYKTKDIKDPKNRVIRKSKIRELIVLGKDLLWFDAKKLRNEHKDKSASIFPNIIKIEEKENENIKNTEKLEVITL